MRYFILSLCCLALSACAVEVEPPKAKISSPSVTIGGDGGSSGGHCPPGLRKQGRCH